MCKQKNRCDQKLDLQFILFSQTRNSIFVLYNMAGDFFLLNAIILYQETSFSANTIHIIQAILWWSPVYDAGLTLNSMGSTCHGSINNECVYCPVGFRELNSLGLPGIEWHITLYPVDTRCWSTIGPMSYMVDQRLTNIASMCGVCWVICSVI